MSAPLAHLYALALRTLDEQERRADALRGRLGPVLAAAALGVTLLSGPVIGGAHPASAGGKLAVVVTISGLLVVTAGAFRVLAARRRPIAGINPRRLAAELDRDGLLADEAAFYEAMILRLGRRLDRAEHAINQLAAAFTAMLWGILFMLCGLAAAAIVG